MSTNVQLELALADLAYSIAYADGMLHNSEWEAFEEMVAAELGGASVSIKNKFLLLGERASPNIEQTYRSAMFSIRANKEHFNEKLKHRYIRILEHIANSVHGNREKEHHLIDRFKKDVELI
jgi:uncharacterized tellurite resistance protein B-like protein